QERVSKYISHSLGVVQSNSYEENKAWADKHLTDASELTGNVTINMPNLPPIPQKMTMTKELFLSSLKQNIASVMSAKVSNVKVDKLKIAKDGRSAFISSEYQLDEHRRENGAMIKSKTKVKCQDLIALDQMNIIKVSKSYCDINMFLRPIQQQER
ncbi:MAG: hypothetical protein ACPG05_05395, partial [Bdellovibrionales bacterium]